MVKLTKIYTRGGDRGESSLVDGTRLPKDDAVFMAIGAVDETNSAIGIARTDASGQAADILAVIQNDLFDLGADIATPLSSNKDDGALRITPEQVKHLEDEIDALTPKLGELTSFVLPGGSRAAASIHMARATARRAERALVTLSGQQETNPEALKYINRLSDLLFQLARLENNGGKDDILWKPGGKK